MLPPRFNDLSCAGSPRAHGTYAPSHHVHPQALQSPPVGWISHSTHHKRVGTYDAVVLLHRELRVREASARTAAIVAANGRRWWYNAGSALHFALSIEYFDQLRLSRLAVSSSRFLNRLVPLRGMPGGVAGARRGYPSAPMPIAGVRPAGEHPAIRD